MINASLQAALERVEDFKGRIIALRYAVEPIDNRQDPFVREDKTRDARHAWGIIEGYLRRELCQAYEQLMFCALYSEDKELIQTVREKVFKEYMMEGMAIASFLKWTEAKGNETPGFSTTQEADWIKHMRASIGIKEEDANAR